MKRGSLSNEEELRNKRLIEIIAMVAEYRNTEALDHGRRVGAFARVLAGYVSQYYEEVSFDEQEVECIGECAMLHDIGKIALPDRVLLKEGHFNAEEAELFHTHTLRGAEMVSMMALMQDEMYAKHCYDICRSHHERFDGSGYPDGLKGNDIPISAQIAGLADAYDILVSERIYKDAYPKETAYQMIINGECGMFSPRMLECFRLARKRMEEAADADPVLLT